MTEGERARILRPDAAGNPDDIVIDCTQVHIERMGSGEWWIGVYDGDKRVSLSLRGKWVSLHVNEDELGLSDDRAP